MLTLVQWKQTRRVDHLDIVGFHPRYRDAGPHNDLKLFDALVNRFWAAANRYDQITVLGEIIEQVEDFITIGGRPLRYRDAARALGASASAEFAALGLAAYRDRIIQDIRRLHAPAQLGQRTLHVNVLYLTTVGNVPILGNIDPTIDAHVLAANQTAGFQAGNLVVTRVAAQANVISQAPDGNSILLAGVNVPVAMRGKFQDSAVGGARLIAACNALNVDRDLDVVYLEEYDQDDVQGRTFRLGTNQYGETPNKPIVTVRRLVAAGGNPATHPTTLAHEIGHALTSYPDHSTDANNLMASGAIRNGLNRLSHGQIGWFRRNAVLT